MKLPKKTINRDSSKDEFKEFYQGTLKKIDGETGLFLPSPRECYEKGRESGFEQAKQLMLAKIKERNCHACILKDNNLRWLQNELENGSK